MLIRVLYESIRTVYDLGKRVKIAGIRLLCILDMIINFYLNQIAHAGDDRTVKIGTAGVSQVLHQTLLLD